MKGYSAGIYDGPKLSELKRRLEAEKEQGDGIIEVSEGSLVRDGQASERPADVAEWLTSCGFDRDIAEFYAEAVRLGHNLVLFEAERDDQHFSHVAQEMVDAESVEYRRALDRWLAGDRDALRPERGTEPIMGTSAGATATTRAGTTERTTIPVVEEELRVGKRETEAGGVVVTKHVEEVPTSEDVTLRKERVEVTRRPVDRPVGAGEGAFEEGQVQVTERAEEAVVAKEARVVEEIEVEKVVEERTETFDDVLRRTHIDIDDVDASEVEPSFRGHFDSTFRNRGGSWDDYSSAYRFGYGYGSRQELADVDYQSAEPRLRERYEQRSGPGRFDAHREAIRYGWEQGRSRRR